MTDSIADKEVHCSYLDGLRGMAVLMVVAVHTSQRVGNDGIGRYWWPTVDQYLDAGARGVQLFFILSALTLFASLDHRMATERRPAVNFYLRRAFRILPFWWLMIGIYAVVQSRSLGESLPSLFMYFGFLRYRDGVDIHPIGWTVFVECMFYIFIPLLFIAIRSLRGALFLYLITFAMSIGWWKLAPGFGVPTANEFVYEFPLTQWFCFALGIVLYFVRKEGVVTRLEAQPWGQWALDGSALVLLWLFLRSYYGVAVIALLAVCLAVVSGQTYLGRLARAKWLGQFGICCYSIYLMHFGILDLLDPLKAPIFDMLGLGESVVEVRFLVWFPVAALINLGAGLLAYTIIERPCVNLGKRLIVRLEQARRAPIAAVA